MFEAELQACQEWEAAQAARPEIILVSTSPDAWLVNATPAIVALVW